jgi:glycine/D-amino acid oxidase-like deaminating enzyme
MRPPSIRAFLSCITGILASFSSRTSTCRPHDRTLRAPVGITRLTRGRHGVIKVCDEFPGFSRFKDHQPYGATAPKPVSVPRSHAKHPTDTYPDASEVTIRKAISTYLPRFKEKELFNRAMCWCTDTADASLLICEHPKWKNFILATGDSG